ncbi:hypothetical protein COP2_016951 [Malus domestica]
MYHLLFGKKLWRLWRPLSKKLREQEQAAPRLQIYSTSDTLSTFWREKYVKDARKYWDVFYKRHQDKLFKSRHYLDKEWGKYFSGAGRKVILEVVVELETIFPLVAMYADVFVHACDFSTTAVNLVKTHKDLVDTRVSAFVCDLTIDDLSKQISSSVSREDAYVMKNNRKVLKPNGCVLFRDSATGDLAQERLNCKDQKISEIFYVRGDGTENDTNSSTKTEAATEVDHLGQEKIVLEVNEKILKKPVNDLEVDISDGVVMEMSGVLPSNDNEVIELELGDLTFKIEVLSKVDQRTCKSTGLMLWESARFMASADISGQTDYKKIRVGNRDHIEAIKEANSQGFDIILGTDVTYVAEAILPLFQTAKEWISSDRSTAEDSEPALIFVIFSFL